MDVLQSIWNVVIALGQLVVDLVQFVSPWVPLLAWIAFWLCAVNWRQLYPILEKGGIIGVILTALMAVLIWSVISVPEGGYHYLYGLKVSNAPGKAIYVTSLVVIAFLCGTVQLSGACDRFCCFKDPEPQEDSH
ncbi:MULTISPECIES: hypothetical protein [Thalassoglobus]|uniref:Uncharacterized protein n=1 Tax=Thalassoglobus polymorphus TaxID=2527994 RepID=A0A517QSV4_9PLAN|nr:hypothetical protein [Thalassoglobus polymorphus]QDT34725.1 hypothetical protein Mal48_39970 [Thalassoglobus polymorphus]